MIDQLPVIGEFISQLRQLEIISVSLASELAQSPSALSGDVDRFLDHLAGTNILTSFQKSALLSGNARSLRKGKYLLLDAIGEGGMGLVYKARHIRMERVVALKMLRTDRSNSAADLFRFRREVQTAARLVHSNIVTAFDADECDGQNFLVMEYIEGQNLAQWARSTPRLPVALVLDTIRQAATGLQYAHDHGTVHRDIKPANLMRTAEGVVKILDLGLARMFVQGTSDSDQDSLLQTETGAILGTVAFMAPEQAAQSSVDARADMYSLGCTLYFLLTGCPPFSAGTALGILDAHRSAPIPQLSVLRPGIADGLQDVLNRMMAKSPSDRFASMSELIAALDVVDFDPQETIISEQVSTESGDDAVTTAANHNDLTGSLVTSATPWIQSVASVPPGSNRSRIASAAWWGGLALLVMFAGILLKFRTPDGDVTVESSRKDLNVSVRGDRSFSIGTDHEPEILSATTSPDGMTVESGNVTTVTRDFVLDRGTDKELRVTMTPPSDLSASGMVGTAEFEQRLEPLRKSDEWIAKWSDELETNSGDAMAQTCRGNRLNEIGQFDLALFDHLEAVRKQPSLAIGWSNLAQSYVNLKQPDQALKAMDTAIQLDPKDSTFRLTRAGLLRQQNKLEEALTELNAAAELPSKDIWVLANRADLLVALNRPDEARKDLNDATALNPSDPLGWVLRAQFFVGQNLTQEAIQDYSTALQLTPDNSTWRADRARCHLRLNQFAEAIADLNEAIQVEPGQVDLLQQRGTAYLSSGMPDKAINDFVAVRRIDKAIGVPDEIREQVEAVLNSESGAAANK